MSIILYLERVSCHSFIACVCVSVSVCVSVCAGELCYWNKNEIIAKSAYIRFLIHISTFLNIHICSSTFLLKRCEYFFTFHTLWRKDFFWSRFHHISRQLNRTQRYYIKVGNPNYNQVFLKYRHLWPKSYGKKYIGAGSIYSNKNYIYWFDSIQLNSMKSENIFNRKTLSTPRLALDWTTQTWNRVNLSFSYGMNAWISMLSLRNRTKAGSTQKKMASSQK